MGINHRFGSTTKAGVKSPWVIDCRLQFLIQPETGKAVLRGGAVSSGRTHVLCCVPPQNLSLRRRWGEPTHHTLSLHGNLAFCPPVLSPPVDQELGHSMLWALQVWLHNGDQAQASSEGTVWAVGRTGRGEGACRAACFQPGFLCQHANVYGGCLSYSGLNGQNAAMSAGKSVYSVLYCVTSRSYNGVQVHKFTEKYLPVYKWKTQLEVNVIDEKLENFDLLRSVSKVRW